MSGPAWRRLRAHHDEGHRPQGRRREADALLGFPGKAALLAEIIRVGVRGDEAATPLAERPDSREAADALHALAGESVSPGQGVAPLNARAMKGDRVEVVVAADDGSRAYEIVATRAGRRVEITTGRGIVEVVEVTRTANRCARRGSWRAGSSRSWNTERARTEERETSEDRPRRRRERL